MFEVVATGGDSALGGDDFDALLADWALATAGLQREHAAGQARRARRRARREGKTLGRRPRHAGVPADAAVNSSQRVTREQFVAMSQPLVDRTLDERAQGAARREDRQGRREGRRDGRRLDPHADGAGGGRRVLRPDAADQPEPRRGGRARCRDPGQRAGGQRRCRRVAAARRDPAVARAGDDGRPGRTHHPAQQHDPDRARTGLHDLQGRPDGDRDPRRAGRARGGERLPLARALRTARHSADGGWRGACAREFPGRCRRPAERHGARRDLGRRGRDHRQAELRPERRSKSRAC